MTGHILPCALEAELLVMLAYVVEHAREILAMIRGWFG